MPRILKYVDQIAREKGRDVLFAAFDKEIYPDYDYEKWTNRTQLIDWLENNKIGYIECFNVAVENYMESYRGEIYIDVCYDENDPTYIKVQNYLENSDGSPRISGVLFYLLPLEIAMKNKHYDEPNFLAKWSL
ncbi:hypothetical protein [Acinetobacter sp. ANC 5414]|uniref:hypothetical protein n=1 Tax=Acinetobacter sp. ANC 5414 TaxID=2731251 RepID=UPI00148FB7DA|nr:hypothetical protein [Acinetobacter sp. ANC 5414]NNH00825.1 hypothetical protein [Acinetobacter sp. ANC 5414]